MDFSHGAARVFQVAPQPGSEVSVRDYVIALGKYWDKKLSLRYPLAPRDLQDLDIIDDEIYRRENARLGALGSDHAKQELDILEAQEGVRIRDKFVRVFGPGLCRDMGFVSHANDKGMRVEAIDISSVSCEATQSFFHSLGPHSSRNVVTHADIGSMLRNHGFGAGATWLIQADQFWQVQSVVRMQQMLVMLGSAYQHFHKWFRMSVVHPFAKDNSKPRVWNSTKLQKPVWGDTTTYSIKDLTEPLEDGLKRKVTAVRMTKPVPFFHQRYRAFTLMTIHH